MTDVVRRYLVKADHALRVARSLLREEFHADAASRAYYAMYYAAQALLIAEGVEEIKHSAVEAEFGRRFAKTGRLDPSLHRMLIHARKVRQLPKINIPKKSKAIHREHREHRGTQKKTNAFFFAFPLCSSVFSVDPSLLFLFAPRGSGILFIGSCLREIADYDIGDDIEGMVAIARIRDAECFVKKSNEVVERKNREDDPSDGKMMLGQIEQSDVPPLVATTDVQNVDILERVTTARSSFPKASDQDIQREFTAMRAEWDRMD